MPEERRELPVLGEVGPGDGADADEESSPERRPMTPLQAELMEEGALPDPDELGRAMLRPNLAPEAGYGEDGPGPLEGPGGARPAGRRRGAEPGGQGATGGGDAADVELPVPVHQWEVDPRDDSLPLGEAQTERDGWQFRMWWQTHPSGLVYASVQALRAHPEEGDGRARDHPVGRAVAVNLVYDTGRRAVAAVYGTARDFRPFVAAFWEAYREHGEETVAPAESEAGGDPAKSDAGADDGDDPKDTEA